MKVDNEFLATFSKKRLFQNTLGGLVPKEWNMSYKLTQTGQRVQELLNQIENGGQSQVTDAVLYSEQALNEK